MRTRMRAFAVLFFCVLVFVTGAKLRLPTALNIPTSDILYNRQYSLAIKSNLFSYSQTDDPANMKIWYMPSIEASAGIKNRVEFGAGYAGGPTLNFKALLLDEGKIEYLPSFAIGAKDIMTSAEAHMFGLEQADTLKAMANCAFIAMGKSFEQFGTRLHLGTMTNFGFDTERFSIFAGAEVYLGGGFYVTYEGFQRFGSFHQFFTVSWIYDKKFLVSAGISELRQAFLGDGKFGLFSDKFAQSNGYGVPGIRFSLVYCGSPSGADASGIRGLEDEVNDLKKSIDAIRKKSADNDIKVDNIEKQLGGLEEDFIALTSRGSSDRQKDYKVVISEQLKSIGDLVETGQGAYDAEEVSSHTKKIVEYKEFALPSLSAIIRNPKANPVMVSLAIQMVGEIGNKKSRQMLLRLLDYKESALKIDALIALGKLRDKAVVKDIEALLQDTDEAVVLTAQEVIYKLTGVKRAAGTKSEQKITTDSIPELDQEIPGNEDTEAPLEADTAKTNIPEAKPAKKPAPSPGPAKK